MKKSTSRAVLLCLGALLFVSCKKAEEDTVATTTTEIDSIETPTTEVKQDYSFSIKNTSGNYNWGEIENYSTDSTDIIFKAIENDITITYLGENRIIYPDWTPEKNSTNCKNTITHHAFILDFPQSITIKKGEQLTKTIKFYSTSFSYYIEQGVNQMGFPNCVLKNSYGKGVYKSELQFEITINGTTQQSNLIIEGKSIDSK